MQTGHPTAVTDCFHQGARALTGEMYMETAAKGADIYLPAAPLARTQEEESKDGEFSQDRLRGVVNSLFGAILKQLLHCTNLWLRGKSNVGRGSNLCVISA